MKKRVKKILFLIILLLVSITVFSCTDPFKNEIKEYGDWLYYEVDQNTVAITGLSEEGKTKETLVFPTMIDGKKVRYVGYKYGYKSSGEFDLSQSNCNEFYIHSLDVNTITGFISSKKNITLFVSSNSSEFAVQLVYLYDDISNVNIYISKYYYDFNESVKYIKRECKIANIEYNIGVDFSESNEDCFFVDYVEQGRIEAIPPEPYKDGFIFDGWYIGEEKWDFEKNNVEDYFTEDNYLKLEAKWDKK